MSISGRASEVASLDVRARTASISRREEDSRSPSLDRSDPFDRTITLPYHGTCSRCHHFHRHVAFDVQLDQTLHTRFNCERCCHPILGLGGADTQLTLASQDSFPINDGVIDFASAGASCSNQSEHPPNLLLNTSSHLPPGPEQLSAIPEQSILGRSRPTSATSASAPIITDALPADPRPILTSAVETGPRPQNLNTFTLNTKQRPKFIWGCIYKVVGRLARRIDGPHEVRFLGLRLQYQLTSDHFIGHQPSSPGTAPPVIDNSPSSDNAQELAQDTSRVLKVDALSVERVEERDGSPSCGQYSRSDAGLARQAHTSAELDTNEDATRKEERLRIDRREKTLKARVLQKKCDCTETCHCKRDGIRSSFSDSRRHSSQGNVTRNGTSRSREWVSAYPLGHFVRPLSMNSETSQSQRGARPDPFTHIGGSNFARWRPSNTTNSDDSSGRGQSSTVASNTSSLSLHPSRPILPGRSLSASLLPLSPSSNAYDLGTMEVLRSLDFVRHTRTVAAGPNFLPWGRGGSLARRMPFNWAVEPTEDSTEAHPPSPLDLSADIVLHPPDQGGPQLVDGLGASSNPSSVHESAREGQPEPHSPILIDGISPDALTELSSPSSDYTTTEATRNRS